MIGFLFHRYIELTALAWLWIPFLWVVVFFNNKPRVEQKSTIWLCVGIVSSLLGFILLRSGLMRIDIPEVTSFDLAPFLVGMTLLPLTLFAVFLAVKNLD